MKLELLVLMCLLGHVLLHDIPGDAVAASQEEECDLCAQKRLLESLTAEDLKTVQVESIKATMLDKLRLTQPPNVTLPRVKNLRYAFRHMLRDLRKHQHEEHAQEHNSLAEEYYAETKEVVRIADSVQACGDDQTSVCIEFKFGDVISSEEIDSVVLQLYFQRRWTYTSSQELTLVDETVTSSSGAPADYHGYKLHHQQYSNSRWKAIKVTETARLWSEKAVTVARFRLKCASCQWNELIRLRNSLASKGPHLEVRVKVEEGRSKRSALRCTRGTTDCCVQDLYVSFQDIGWNWIIDPPGFSPNTCRGSCANGLRLTQHSQLILAHQASQQGRSRGQQSEGEGVNQNVTPCCSPAKMTGLDLVYMDENGNVQSKRLPKMIVESCGCA